MVRIHLFGFYISGEGVELETEVQRRQRAQSALEGIPQYTAPSKLAASAKVLFDDGIEVSDPSSQRQGAHKSGHGPTNDGAG